MSLRYKGGVISATPPTTSTSSASGSWTLQQQLQAIAAGLWPVNGPFYIEDVFSTYLYTGNGSTQTITNGIDLSGQGGLTWVKTRSNTLGHVLVDTVRGAGKYLSSNTTNQQFTNTDTISAFTSSGFTVGNDNDTNSSGATYASWTFREQPKFFDVVTWTGDGVSGRAISHNLGSVPGCIIVKCTSTSGDDWCVYHRSLGRSSAIFLNLASASGSSALWDATDPTSTTFTLSSNGSVNGSGDTYVAYLFAHDAGGFGLTGTDNVISCGSYTGAGASTTINLGFEPQWVMIKNTASPFPWWIQDNMRGMTVAGDNGVLYAQVSDAEAQRGSHVIPTATGFTFTANEGDLNGAGNTYIYIAIRRGPMKTPTSGTSVFAPYVTSTVAASASGSTSTSSLYNPGFVTDWVWQQRKTLGGDWYNAPRLTGTDYLLLNSTAAQASSAAIVTDSNVGAWNFATDYGIWAFRRAPGFFDVVCYTGTGSARTINHNLGVVPELMIVKRRNNVWDWMVYTATDGPSYYYWLNDTSARRGADATIWNSTTPTSSVFSVGTGTSVNASASTYVAYLFASCPGVSKVGSYTGTGTTKQIDCGFTAGARFVLIKRTDSTGDWYVWDSARGIVAGNDPYLLLNSTAAEVTSTDYVDTYSAGFEISSAAPAAINANGGTFIFLAIA